MLPRTLEPILKKSASQYPLVGILGPRQSGKTTLAKKCFPQKKYVSLENPDDRLFAQTDPKGFFKQFPEGGILDEIQRVPDLFSYLQVLSDEKKKNGFFIITGSQNYLLMEKITQSLAGRISLHILLPFSQEELQKKLSKSLYINLWKGGYPRVYEENLNPAEWGSNYIQTYIERDVRELKNVGNLSSFTKFLKMCAARCGQLLNLSSLGDDCGITHNTAKAWLSVLEASYIVFLFQPFHKNFNKRLVKSPKIYFYDTGLLCYLLGIHSHEQIITHPYKGGIFESHVVSELIKRKNNHQKFSSFYFWRDNSEHEIDCLVEAAQKLIPIEIKSGETFSSDYLKNFKFWTKMTKEAGEKYLVYAGETSFERQGIRVISWKDLDQIGI